MCLISKPSGLGCAFICQRELQILSVFSKVGTEINTLSSFSCQKCTLQLSEQFDSKGTVLLTVYIAALPKNS